MKDSASHNIHSCLTRRHFGGILCCGSVTDLRYRNDFPWYRNEILRFWNATMAIRPVPTEINHCSLVTLHLYLQHGDVVLSSQFMTSPIPRVFTDRSQDSRRLRAVSTSWTVGVAGRGDPTSTRSRFAATTSKMTRLVAMTAAAFRRRNLISLIITSSLRHRHVITTTTFRLDVYKQNIACYLEQN